MTPKSAALSFAFVAAYALHAGAVLSLSGDVAWLKEGPAHLVALLSLLAMLCLVAVHIGTRDEVLRRFALVAGAVSALAAGALSYGLTFVAAPPFWGDHLWAVAIAVWFAVYGALRWRALS